MLSLHVNIVSVAETTCQSRTVVLSCLPQHSFQPPFLNTFRKSIGGPSTKKLGFFKAVLIPLFLKLKDLKPLHGTMKVSLMSIDPLPSTIDNLNGKEILWNMQ